MRRALLLVVLLAVPAVAQDTAPALTEVQQLTLDRHQLRLENLSLRMALLQAEYATEQAALSAAVRGLAREGWTLRRGADGAWGYTPEAPK
ncbi:MAG: hypothetical protein AB7R67_18890 [Vicinamibacterales bacterium]